MRSKIALFLLVVIVISSCGEEEPSLVVSTDIIKFPLGTSHQSFFVENNGGGKLRVSVLSSPQFQINPGYFELKGGEKIEVSVFLLDRKGGNIIVLSDGERSFSIDVMVETLVTRKEIIVDSPFLTVNPQGYQLFKFEVKPGMLSPQIELSFEELWGYDIKVLIVSDVEYKNWESGSEFKCYYYRRVAADDEVIPLSDQGVYYLIFDNRYSIFTSKLIRAKATLVYSEVAWSGGG